MSLLFRKWGSERQKARKSFFSPLTPVSSSRWRWDCSAATPTWSPSPWAQSEEKAEAHPDASLASAWSPPVWGWGRGRNTGWRSHTAAGWSPHSEHTGRARGRRKKSSVHAAEFRTTSCPVKMQSWSRSSAVGVNPKMDHVSVSRSPEFSLNIQRTTFPFTLWQKTGQIAASCSLTLLARRIWAMRGRPCVTSSSVYSSSSMQLNSFSRPWIRGRRCWWKHVRRDSSHVCKVQGTPEEQFRHHMRGFPTQSCTPEAFPGRTEAAYVDGDVHVSVLSAVVHGFLQGFEFGFSGSDLFSVRRTSTFRLGTLSQDLLQGQNICFSFVCVGQESTKDVSAGGERQKEALVCLICTD